VAERDPLRRRDRIARKPERAWQHAGAAAGQKAERHVELETVEHLVVGAVAAEDVERVEAAHGPGDRGRLARGHRDPRLRSLRKRGLHGSEPVLVDTGCERVDDQQPAHGPRLATDTRTARSAGLSRFRRESRTP
jgi:hypothetical protein